MPEAPMTRPREPRAPDLLTGPEVLALINACSTRSFIGLRNRALLTVLYRGGLRLSEALALSPADLDETADTILVRRGKGGKYRVVGVDPGAWAVIDRWRERRGKLRLSGPHPLFCTLKGGPLLQSYVRGMLARVAHRAGVTRRVHAHGFRHLFAVELHREGIPLRDIQRLLGHSSLQTTAIYLERMAPEESLAHIRRRRWPGMPAPGESQEPAAAGSRLTAT